MDALRRMRTFLPRGIELSETEWARRHRTLLVLLAAQVPLLFLFGLWRGWDPWHLAVELAVPVAAALAGAAPKLQPRLRSIVVTAGLVFESAALVHLSGGYIEAHFHFFAMLGFIALYQDWAPFGWSIGFVAASHTYMSLVDPGSMFNHEAALQQPVVWAGIHAFGVAVASAGQLTTWRAAERDADERARLREQAATARRDAVARLYVDLSRRTGSLLHEQTALIDELERTVDDPDTLGSVFRLDHLVTQARRNAESLLVVAGDEPIVTRRAPLDLLDVARAAASEIRDYERVAIEVRPGATAVRGAASRDVAHLLAELLDNGTAFSSPGTQVRLTAAPAAADGSVELVVTDDGIGLDDEQLARAAALFEDPERTLDTDATRHLGWHVVARLAARHGLDVRLEPRAERGTRATVTLGPGVLVLDEDRAPAPDAAPAAAVDPDQAPPSAPASPFDGDTPGPRRTGAAALGREGDDALFGELVQTLDEDGPGIDLDAPAPWEPPAVLPTPAPEPDPLFEAPWTARERGTATEQAPDGTPSDDAHATDASAGPGVAPPTGWSAGRRTRRRRADRAGTSPDELVLPPPPAAPTPDVPQPPPPGAPADAAGPHAARPTLPRRTPPAAADGPAAPAPQEATATPVADDATARRPLPSRSPGAALPAGRVDDPGLFGDGGRDRGAGSASSALQALSQYQAAHRQVRGTAHTSKETP